MTVAVASAASNGSVEGARGKPAKDTALSQLLRPLAAFLAPADVTEVAVNRPGELWTRSGVGWTRHESPDLSGEYLQALCTAMAVYNGLALRSVVSVVLPRGERGQIIRPPACIDGMTPVTIRKHLAVVKTLDELDAEGAFARARDVSFHHPSVEEAEREGARRDVGRLEAGELELLALKRSRQWTKFFRRSVEQKRNIVIAGKTGSGKTTLARSLIEEVPRSERIVTIEDVHELDLPNHPNRVHLMFGEGEGRVTAEACLAACMRLSPDRIFLAELRGSEAWEYVGGSNTGHPGSITTTHANGAVAVFERVATLVKNSPVGRGLEVSEIRRVLQTTLEVLVFIHDWEVREVFYDPIFAREKLG